VSRFTSGVVHARNCACALLWLAVTGACTDGSPYGSADAVDVPARGAQQALSAAPSNGFGEAIAWRSLSAGLSESTQTRRPVMLTIHASWCESCKQLKPQFHDPALVELSREFIMINIDQDLETRSLEFAPDGDYVPRIVFLDPRTGKADPDLQNKARARNHYYYGPSDDIVAMMKEALSRYGNIET
jgi:thiol-disulfide isomerase/thioredoxin